MTWISGFDLSMVFNKANQNSCIESTIIYDELCVDIYKWKYIAKKKQCKTTASLCLPLQIFIQLKGIYFILYSIYK